MIRDISESVGNAVLDGVGRLAGRTQERRPLPTDLLESDDAYLVVFDAPDANAEDIQVRFSDTAVHVRIDRVREHREDFEMRFPGRGLALDGQAELPTDATVDPDAATATLTDTGTLEVELPKVADPTDEPIRISTDATDGADEGRIDAGDTDTGTEVDDAVRRVDENEDTDE
jgi:HSP20 family protein